MEKIQDSLKTDPEITTSLMRKLKMKQIQDGLKTDPEITTSLTRKLKMKQIQDSLKADLVINSIDTDPFEPPDFTSEILFPNRILIQRSFLQ